MRRKLTSLIRDERGDGPFSILFGFFIFLFILLIAVTVFDFYSKRDNLKTGVNEILQIVKIENGADHTTKAKFDDLIKRMKIDPSQVRFSATPKLVQRGDPVEVTASMDFNFYGLKVIGVDMNFPITVKATGLAHRFIR